MVRAVRERLAAGETLIGDGAMGTMLQAAGLPVGTAPEQWNLTAGEKVLAVHQGYVEAGSDLIQTNTFGGNRIKMAKMGLQALVGEANRQGALLARQAAGDSVLVAGDIGPTGDFLEPLGELAFEKAVEAFAEQAAALLKGGVDLFVIETFADLGEMRAAVEGVRRVCDLPIFCTMTFNANLHTIMGTTPSQAARELSQWGVEALGTNCGVGPEEAERVLREMAVACPGATLMVQPNAGLPHLTEAGIVYDCSPETMARYAVRYRALGARIIGACCGSTPAHIAAIVGALRGDAIGRL